MLKDFRLPISKFVENVPFLNWAFEMRVIKQRERKSIIFLMVNGFVKGTKPDVNEIWKKC
jgi:hypothetical protein